MANLLFYLSAISLGFFPYYHGVTFLQFVYHFLVILLTAIYCSGLVGVLFQNIEIIESVMQLNMPSKLFSVILVLFLGGTAAVYGHWAISICLVFIGFSWSVFLDLQKSCGV